VVWFRADYLSKEQASTFWIAAPLVIIVALTQLRGSALRALRQAMRSALPDSILRPVCFGLVVGLVYFLNRTQLSASLVMAINFLAALLAFGIGSWWLYRVLPKNLPQVTAQFEAKTWLSVSFPLFVMASMGVIRSRTDGIMLGSLLDPEQVAFYGAASRIGELAAFGLMAVNASIVPMISELYHHKKLDELQRLITLAARGIFLSTALISVALIVFGKLILGLYGTTFTVAYVPLVVILAGQAINALTGCVGFLMTMTSHHFQAMILGAITLVLGIILNAVLIPALGMNGAALATAISTSFINISMLVFVRVKLKLNPSILPIWRK
jgi:O-antigen/teichoic acid export membrane protein